MGRFTSRAPHGIPEAQARAEADLREAREALRVSQERLTAALAAGATGTFRWVFATGVTEWDESLGPLFGVEPAPGSHRFGELIHTLHVEDRAAVRARLLQCRADGSPFDMEFRVVHPDGVQHWLAMKATVVSDADGTPLYMTGACRDVTRLKAAEEALREETRMLEVLNASPELANVAPDGGCVARPERGATRFERRGRRLGHRVFDLEYVRR